MGSRATLVCVLVLVASLLLGKAAGQKLAPVDISGFPNARLLQTYVTSAFNSECKAFTRGSGALDHYDVSLSGVIVFRNSSSTPVILYKEFVVLTGRVALSSKDITDGKFVAGFDSDRMAIGKQPKKVPIRAFVTIAPGKFYRSVVRATIPASGETKTQFLRIPGKYWVQLGIDARPDEFYFDAGEAKAFQQKWQSRGQLVQFVLSQPFLVDFPLDPAAGECKE